MMKYWTEYAPPSVVWGKRAKGTQYAEISSAFDTETSSFMYYGEPRGTMYVWQWGIGDQIYYGRTWDDFKGFYSLLVLSLGLNLRKRLMVFVHNLEFDFAFFRKHIPIHQVFSLDSHKPLYAVTADGVEFRDSYMLAGYSLEKVGENLTSHNVKKLVGDLDYDLMRHSQTPLTEKELAYMEHDILVLLAYIDETRAEYGEMRNIPYTKTGKVRRLYRSSCLPSPKEDKRRFWDYHRLMFNLTLTPRHWEMLRDAFMGGFVHASAYTSGKVLYDVASLDISSSYPAALVCEKYPMSSPREYTPKDTEDLRRCFREYCCLFDMEIYNLEARPEADFEHILSFSKCRDASGRRSLDNGRVVFLEHCRITITEVDYEMLELFYTWDREQTILYNFHIMTKAYLPHDFVRTLLQLYANKTRLKGVAGKEAEYLNSKEMTNSSYGMAVTMVVRPEFKYTNDTWEKIEPDIAKQLTDYNKKWNRFLYFPWGVWCTAYARRNVFSAIYSCAGDYHYSDTDSVKITNYADHKAFFDKYNENVRNKLRAACDYHKFPYDLCEPKTIKGVKKPLGVFEYEGTYSTFKTIGSKRYLYVQDGEMKMVVAGLSKAATLPYLLRTYHSTGGVYAAFNHGLCIPAAYTGKKTHFYIDDETSGTIIDYMGNKAEWHELSSISLQPTSFNMSQNAEYMKFIMGLTWREFL